MENHVIDLIPEYALGCLEEGEKVQIGIHIEKCETCKEELLRYQGIVDELAEAIPLVEPPSNIRETIFRTVRDQEKHGISSKTAPQPRRISLPVIFRGLSPAWGILSLAVITLLVVTNVMQLWGTPNHERPQPSDLRVVQLSGTDFSPNATGILVISTDGEYGTLIVDRLPSLSEEQQFQLWLIQDGQRENGGVFSVNQEGYGSLVVSSPEALNHYSSYGITIEPFGGSPGPTGEKVLGGSL